MAHNHDHSHDGSTYYVEQLCTIGICGAIGIVTILLYTDSRGLLGLMLKGKSLSATEAMSLLSTQGVRGLLQAWGLHWMVLAGGIALLGLVAIRAVAVWFSVGKPAPAHNHNHDHAHAHDHEHGPGCDHDHAHDHDHGHVHEHHHDHEHGPGCEHDHPHEHEHVQAEAAPAEDDHGHEHGWGPWRYAVLLLPVVLFFLDLPNECFSSTFGGGQPSIDVSAENKVEDKDVAVTELSFKELQSAAYDPEKRQAYEGRTVQIRGQLAPSGNDTFFRLVRYKINCCAADAIPLDAVILIDPASKERLQTAEMRGKWVLVTGQVQFRKRKDREEYATVIFVRPTKEHALAELIQTVTPDNNPYI
jgi:hypothetical protein